jgi:hypothetical protein
VHRMICHCHSRRDILVGMLLLTVLSEEKVVSVEEFETLKQVKNVKTTSTAAAAIDEFEIVRLLLGSRDVRE